MKKILMLAMVLLLSGCVPRVDEPMVLQSAEYNLRNGVTEYCFAAKHGTAFRFATKEQLNLTVGSKYTIAGFNQIVSQP